jgi:hypothetical protein
VLYFLTFDIILFHTLQPQQSPFGLSSTSSNPLADIQAKVTAIYSQHNPSKLSEIPALMHKYAGKELQLLANLEKKYGAGGL